MERKLEALNDPDRNYNRISGNGNEAKYVCYGPPGNGACYAGAYMAGNSSLVSMGSSGSYGYGTAGVKIPEGYLQIEIPTDGGQSVSSEILYPSNPGSISSR